MKTDFFEPVQKDEVAGTIQMLCHLHPVSYVRLRELYEKYSDIVIVETMLHIAMTETLPLWAAEQKWVEW